MINLSSKVAKGARIIEANAKPMTLVSEVEERHFFSRQNGRLLFYER